MINPVIIVTGKCLPLLHCHTFLSTW